VHHRFLDSPSAQLEENIVIPLDEQKQASRIVADKVAVVVDGRVSNPQEVLGILQMLGLAPSDFT